MSKKKPAIITVKKTLHKKQPYVVTVDKVGPGPDITIQERYTKKWSAVRRALSELDARTSSGISGRRWRYAGGYTWYTPKGNPIIVIYTTSKRAKK